MRSGNPSVEEELMLGHETLDPLRFADRPCPLWSCHLSHAQNRTEPHYAAENRLVGQRGQKSHTLWVYCGSWTANQLRNDLMQCCILTRCRTTSLPPQRLFTLHTDFNSLLFCSGQIQLACINFVIYNFMWSGIVWIYCYSGLCIQQHWLSVKTVLSRQNKSFI